MSDRTWHLLDGPMRFEEIKAVTSTYERPADIQERVKVALDNCIARIENTINAWLGDEDGYDVVHKDKDGEWQIGLQAETFDSHDQVYVRVSRRVCRVAKDGRSPMKCAEPEQSKIRWDTHISADMASTFRTDS